ncbi:MAG: hypothetical protein ABEL76_00305, partial [Bradymonadaceae bacterium]
MTSIDETIDEFGAPADLEHLLVVDQCSAKKAHPDDAPVLDREEIDAHRRGELGFDPPFETPAAELYVGRQQREIGRGVEAARSSDRELDRYFVSA